MAEEKKGTETPNTNPPAETPAAPKAEAQADKPKKTVEAEIAELILNDQQARTKPPTLLYTAAGALSMATRILALLPKK